MTDWADISFDQVAVFSDVDASTELAFRNRTEYLKEVLQGTHANKIPAQAIQTYSAGSGNGLKLSHMIYYTQTITGTTPLPSASQTYTTTLGGGGSFVAACGMQITGGAGTGTYNYRLYYDAASNKYYVRIYHDAGGSGTNSFSAIVVLIGVA